MVRTAKHVHQPRASFWARWRVAGTVALCLLAIAPNAHADQPPGPMLLMSEILILPVMITLFLMGQAFAFVGYWPSYAGRERFQQFQRFVAHQMAHAERQESQSGIRQYRRMAGEDLRQSPFYAPASPSFRIDYGPGERSFTAYLVPGRFPFFPYNYLTSQPSYRADQSGQIRMVNVRWKDALCPPDAPIVMTIGQEEIKAARQRLEALEAAKEAPPDSGREKPKAR